MLLSKEWCSSAKIGGASVSKNHHYLISLKAWSLQTHYKPKKIYRFWLHLDFWECHGGSSSTENPQYSANVSLIAKHNFAPVNKSAHKHGQSSDQGILTARDHFQGEVWLEQGLAPLVQHNSKTISVDFACSI